MQKQDQLFQLIGSLSKAEKRHFKRFAGKGESGRPSKYIILFDVLSTMEEYDEERLIRRIRGKIQIARLPDIKLYLYNLIVKSLHIQYSEANAELRVSDLIDSARILFYKGLVDHAIRLLNRAEKEADKFDLQLAKLEIMGMRASCMAAKSSAATTDSFLPERRKILKGLERDYEYVDLMRNIQRKFNGGAIRGERLNEVSHILNNHPLLAADAVHDSIQSYYTYLYIIASLHHLSGDHLGCIQHLEIQAAQFEIRPYLENEPDHLIDYLGTLNNLGHKYIQTRQFGRLTDIIAKLTHARTLPSSRLSLVLEIADMARIPLTLMYYTSIGDFTAAVEYFERERAASPLLFNQVRIIYRGAYGYFGAGLYEKALELTNHLLQSTRLPFVINKGEILIANALIHYELGNLELVGYLGRSIYRHLHRKNKMFNFERVVLRYTEKLLKAPSEPEARAVFIQFRDDLERVFQDPTERNAAQIFDLVSWLESKITERPFAEIVRERSSGGSATVTKLLADAETSVP